MLQGPLNPLRLTPGDTMLYYSKDSLVDRIIAIKTWTYVSHIEIYVGYFEHEGQLGHWSVASRNGIGVGLYKTRWDDLVCVREPRPDGNLNAAMRWFWTKANGQGYDWKGLLCFSLAVKQGSHDKMFCSEFATRWYRFFERPQFDNDWDADRTPPMFYLTGRQMRTKWQIGPLH